MVAVPWRHSFMSLFQAVLSISILAYLSAYWSEHDKDRVLLIASFGASAVLLHSAIRAPLAQPRNVIVGHTVSAVVGVTVFKVLISSSRRD